LNAGAAQSSDATAGPPLLLTREDVAALLAVPLKELTWWVWALRKSRQYDRFTIARRKGGTPREICAPIKPIKDLQRRLADVLTSCYEAPVHVHGFVPERSSVSNAHVHVGKEWVFRADISDFFPSINFGRVIGMFRAFPFEYPDDVASLLAALCCYENELPQGAPTSPIIANYISRRMDTHLAQLARSERCHYSRYADDLCFSTDRTTFPKSIGFREGDAHQAGTALSTIVTENGFAINDEKTRLTGRTQRQRVTGLVVNEKVNVPRNYIRELRGLLHVWKQYGEAEAKAALDKSGPHINWPPGKPPPTFRLVVRGRVQYVGSVKGWDSTAYVSLAERLQQLDPDYRPTNSPAPASTIRVFTEGVSDLRHLKAAAAYFAARGEFTDLKLDFDEGRAGEGDDKLLKQCQVLARLPQPVPAVFVFDRDVERTLRAAVDKGDWKDWGNGVVAVALAPPPWRGSTVCVEMLYPDDVLERTDSNGRRLYLAEEFDDQSGAHRDHERFAPNPQNRALVREHVFLMKGNTSVGLSKMDFADAIVEKREPFADIDFEGFRPTFEILREAVQAANRQIAET
jgi:RNA-directed DNA polymerase